MELPFRVGGAYTQVSEAYWGAHDYWGTRGDVDLLLTRGDAVCAHDMVTQPWRTTIGLYWGLGPVGALMFVWLWLITFLL